MDVAIPVAATAATTMDVEALSGLFCYCAAVEATGSAAAVTAEADADAAAALWAAETAVNG